MIIPWTREGIEEADEITTHDGRSYPASRFHVRSTHVGEEGPWIVEIQRSAFEQKVDRFLKPNDIADVK